MTNIGKKDLAQTVNGPIKKSELGFTCSGSSDFLAGQAFSFVMTLDAVGPVLDHLWVG